MHHFRAQLRSVLFVQLQELSRVLLAKLGHCALDSFDSESVTVLALILTSIAPAAVAVEAVEWKHFVAEDAPLHRPAPIPSPGSGPFGRRSYTASPM
jgi:hypothetical protein